MSCPAARVSRLVIQWTVTGKVISNVLHVRSQAEPDPSELAAIAAEVISWWDAGGAKAQFSNNVALTAVEVTSTNVTPPIQVIDVTGLPISGTIANAVLPLNVAVVASLRTGNIGRSYRGRIYLPPPPESGVTGITLEAATQAGLLAVVEGLIDQLANINVAVGVLSCVQEGVSIDPGVFTPVQSVIVNTRVDTQRRRLNA